MFQLITAFLIFILSSNPFSYPLLIKGDHENQNSDSISETDDQQIEIHSELQNYESDLEDDEDTNGGYSLNSLTDSIDNSSVTTDQNTEKVIAYNSSSGKVIESVAKVAVEKAPPLDFCDDNYSESCNEFKKLTPTPIPEPTPTPLPFPDTIPTVIPEPPIPIPTIIPEPPECLPFPIINEKPSQNYIVCLY